MKKDKDMEMTGAGHPPCLPGAILPKTSAIDRSPDGMEQAAYRA